ncbi:MAG: hypothetical protein ACQZ3N_02760 [cyanobacterium endosymbiont of Rhopalodia yunnanensis]
MVVFIPVTFFSRITEVVYRWSSMTIIFAVSFSTFNALSLLCKPSY